MSESMEYPDDEDDDPSEGLGPDLELVALLLAQGQSDAAAGLAVGRSAKFVQRARSSTPGLVARIRELKAHRATQAGAALGALLEDAVDALRRGLWAEKTADQLRAAALIFDRYRDFWAESETAERIRELQAEVADLRSVVGGADMTSAPLESEETP